MRSQSCLPEFSRVLLSFLIAVTLGTGCRTTPETLPTNTLATHDSSRWTNEIATLEARAATNPPPARPILFVGSSSIRMWTNLDSAFPGYPVFNRGFGGSQLADAYYYADRIILHHQPRQVVIYSGGNDINAGKNPDVVFGDFVALAARIRAALPKTRLTFISIAPSPARWNQVDRVREANRLIENYCKRQGIDFVNVFDLMLGPDGQPRPDIYIKDRLHLNEKGYAIWQAALKPYLVKPNNRKGQI